MWLGLIALASPGGMIKVSSYKTTASSMMSWCAQLATGLVGAGCLMLGRDGTKLKFRSIAVFEDNLSSVGPSVGSDRS